MQRAQTLPEFIGAPPVQSGATEPIFAAHLSPAAQTPSGGAAEAVQAGAAPPHPAPTAEEAGVRVARARGKAEKAEEEARKAEAHAKHLALKAEESRKAAVSLRRDRDLWTQVARLEELALETLLRGGVA